MATTFPPSRQRRVLIENLTAYALLLPAGVLLFIFGIFPVAFAFYVSLMEWRRFPDAYLGTAHYERALGEAGYVLFFWLGVALIVLGLRLIPRLFALPLLQRLGTLIAGVASAIAALLFVDWFFQLLPIILTIPVRLRGQEVTGTRFISEFFAAFPPVSDKGNLMLIAACAAVLLTLLIVRELHVEADAVARAAGAGVLVGAGVLILLLNLNAITTTIETARAAGTELPIWTQVILISGGAALIPAAWWIWRKAQQVDDGRRFVILAIAAVELLIAAYLLIAELPCVLGEADQDMLQAFGVTVMYVIGTVPIQLCIGLLLAYLLFQNLKGKTIFRMIYFLPYIMPFVATAMVFSLLFSHRPDSPMNNLLGLFGIPPQNWLIQPKGIFQLIFGEGVPDALAGPSLALIVIMIYSIWTYAGYNTVVFLAGLGNISTELYEAARIDGATGWTIFRYITLPLLSPTTFFLSLVAVIGTFQAFTQIWIMRTPGSAGAVDTVTVYIFERIQDASPNYGYAAALSFVLFAVILTLTLIQNRFASRRVFYQ